MDINELIEQTRKIVKTHYEAMEHISIDSDPEITKEDLRQQLQAFKPGMSADMMGPLYDALERQGYANLVTNDTVTFSKSFIGK